MGYVLFSIEPSPKFQGGVYTNTGSDVRLLKGHIPTRLTCLQGQVYLKWGVWSTSDSKMGLESLVWIWYLIFVFLEFIFGLWQSFTPQHSWDKPLMMVMVFNIYALRIIQKKKGQIKAQLIGTLTPALSHYRFQNHGFGSGPSHPDACAASTEQLGSALDPCCIKAHLQP